MASPPTSTSSPSSGPDQLLIFDTSLRDGEQSPGVHLDGAAKIRIGQELARLGVDICEIGFPACAVDLEAVRSLVREVGDYREGRADGQPMRLCVLSRCVTSDIDIAWDVIQHAPKPRIHVFYGTSDLHLQYKLKKTRAEALDIITKAVSYARSKCADIEFSAEDASRTDLEFLVQVFGAAIQAGATTLNVPDTVGNALPHQFGLLISQLRQQVEVLVGFERFKNVVWSVHCHNDLGLATANACAAIRSGCRQVECTINGIGERAGNTAMEEVVMAVHIHPQAFNADGLTHHINTRQLVPTSNLVAELTGISVQRNKAIVGANCCLHESGVHVDGILKNRSTYEIFPAELVGWTNTSGIVLGKHSGRAAYKQRMADFNVKFADEESLNRAFARFQALVTANKEFTTEQLALTAEEAPKTGLSPPAAATAAPAAAASSSSSSSSRPERKTGEYHIIELIGDGISEEVTTEGVRVLKALAEASNGALSFTFEKHPIGGRAIDLTGSPLPDSTLSACRASDAVLLGAVGDPKYSDPKLTVRPEQGLLKIRSELQLYQNLRPVKVYPELIDASPFKKEVVLGTDLMIVRELTGGIYNNVHEQTQTDAKDIMAYTVNEIERIVRAAGHLARKRKKKVVSLDKANVLACSRLWRSVTARVMAEEFPDVKLEHQLIDSAAMLMIKYPTQYDVMVMENLFGDILSDEAAALASSLGMLGSASIGHPNTPGLFEPVHGSAPDIAGKGIANPIGTLLAVSMLLKYGLGLDRESDALERAIEQTVRDGIVTPDIVRPGQTPSKTDAVGRAIAERTVAFYRASAPSISKTLITPLGRRPMTLPEKILCHQAVGLEKPEVRPGEVIVVKVHRTLASEMTWVGMSETWESIGKPALWRKDRFFLAVDHTVDPSNYEQPHQQRLIGAAESFAKSIQLDDYFGPNTSILHTEFYRQRALPGTVIVGADSHSCSAGCLGAFAAGLGAADVVMPVVTGQTFFQVPETLLINFVNHLPFGMTGKDVMLYLLQKLKRNTVAFERAVEFSGSIRSLSVDSRFALANMATEFGAIAGIFPSDEVTAAFMAGRKRDKKKLNIKSEESSTAADETDDRYLNFRADANAQYADAYNIDLSTITPLIAKYPSPDNVYPIDDPEIDAIVPEVGRSIRNLDGVFIGACTTTEEELILAALVLEVAIKEGFKATKPGTRKVTPGSAIMYNRLQEIGVLDIYRSAGFTIGAPGCSYCLGVGADVAPKGSVWLSSQNRNFRNRMGPGSIGSLASAATVAISSFNLVITDPRPFLAKVDKQRYAQLLDREKEPESIKIHEPQPELASAASTAPTTSSAAASAATPLPTSSAASKPFDLITGRVQRFGDHVDTDAIIPGQLMLERPLSRLAKFSFKHVRPEFVDRVGEGRNIVVGGEGFGSGSSREEAVSCLRACGVKAVIAKSFAFIFGRNLLCLDLLGIVIKDEEFYRLAEENRELTIDVEGRKVTIEGRVFPFDLSEIQLAIYRQGGVIEMYRQSGTAVFRQLASYAKKRQLNGDSESGKGGCGGGGCGTKSGTSDPAYEDKPESQAVPTKKAGATGKLEW